MDAESILVERAARDFEEGLAHARERIRATYNRFAAGTLDALVMSAVGVLKLREQMREDARFLVGLARRVAAGEDAAALADANLERALRLKQMAFLARVDDPAFGEVIKTSRETFAKRLPDLARMVSVAAPKDYDDLVRRAFPEKAHVVRIVVENQRDVQRIVDHLERHPHLLRLPQALVPKIAATAREVVDWQAQRVLRGVDEIYE